MKSLSVKPIIIKSDDIKKICYGLSNFIMRNEYDNGIIISESGQFLDELFDYMNKVKMPHSYYRHSTEKFNKGFMLVDKHNSDKVLEQCFIELFDNLPVIKGHSMVYCLFNDEPFFLTLKQKSEYTKIDLSSSELPLHLVNHEIKEMFLESFRIVEKELDICSPWISKNVVNEKFIRLMREALYRNVTIKILYGLDSSSDEFNINRSRNSDCIAEFLKLEFSDFYSKTFFIQRDNIHYKVVLCDDKFKLEGSYNYLSFDGEYYDSSVRKEGSPFGTNIEEIKKIRGLYFEHIQ